MFHSKKRKAPLSGGERRSDCWRTPRCVFEFYDKEFWFFADVAASDENTLCSRYITRKEDALSINWGRRWKSPGPFLVDVPLLEVLSDQEIQALRLDFMWCNCPFSDIERWLEKAVAEMSRGLGTVMLLPYCGSKYWSEKVIPFAARIDMYVGRVPFGDPDTGVAQNNCNFATSVVLFDPKFYYSPRRSQRTVKVRWLTVVNDKVKEL